MGRLLLRRCHCHQTASQIFGPASIIVNPGTANEKRLAVADRVELKRGDLVRHTSPGGGGFGDPMTRDPVRVGRDVNLGYVTKAAARNEYGVVIGENGAVDTAATAALRSGAGQ